MLIKICGLFYLVNYVSSFIVPQEVPSLLSLVYSNIPPIKKGIDSRYGIGFRLGEHADFQVLVELGPQKYTRPIGQSSDSASSKRETEPIEFEAQESVKKTVGEAWISNWSKNMNQNEEQDNVEPKKTYQMPIIPDEALRQLQQLYKKPNETSGDQRTIDSIDPVPVIVENNYSRKPIVVSSQKTKSKITAELMDVDLER